MKSNKTPLVIWARRAGVAAGLLGSTFSAVAADRGAGVRVQTCMPGAEAGCGVAAAAAILNEPGLVAAPDGCHFVARSKTRTTERTIAPDVRFKGAPVAPFQFSIVGFDLLNRRADGFAAAPDFQPKPSDRFLPPRTTTVDSLRVTWASAAWRF